MKAESHTQGYKTTLSGFFKNAGHCASTPVKVGQRVAGNKLLIK